MTTNLNPIHNLIVQHPFATVLTVAFCLIVCLPLLLYIITKITALIKFFKGKWQQHGAGVISNPPQPLPPCICAEFLLSIPLLRP